MIFSQFSTFLNFLGIIIFTLFIKFIQIKEKKIAVNKGNMHFRYVLSILLYSIDISIKKSICISSFEFTHSASLNNDILTHDVIANFYLGTFGSRLKCANKCAINEDCARFVISYIFLMNTINIIKGCDYLIFVDLFICGYVPNLFLYMIKIEVYCWVES